MKSSTTTAPAPVPAKATTPSPAANETSYEELIAKAETATVIKDYLGAVRLYDAARSLPQLSAEQKARAQFGFAASRHEDARAYNRPLNMVAAIQADYEAALSMPQLPPLLRMQALEAVGDLLLLRGQRLDAIRSYQKILSVPSASNPATQFFYLHRIFTELPRLQASPDALAVADATYRSYLPLQKTPQAVTLVKRDFAKILLNQRQVPRAITIWNEIADDQSLPLPARIEALRQVSATQRSLKNWPEALQAADHLVTLVGAPPQAKQGLVALRGWDRGAVFLAQSDEAAARAEWQAMIASPDITATEKANAWREIAASFGRELQAGADTANPTAEAARQKAYESAWKLEGAAAGTRVQALLDLGQIHLDAHKPDDAIAVLTAGLKDVEQWRASPDDVADAKLALNFALSAIYRSRKQFAEATNALIQAQQNNKKDDPKIAKAAIAVSQEAFAAKQWDAARSTLTALKDIWGISRKMYLMNLAQVEVADQKWAEAKKVLAELDTLNPTPAEKATLDKLHQEIPAT